MKNVHVQPKQMQTQRDSTNFSQNNTKKSHE